MLPPGRVPTTKQEQFVGKAQHASSDEAMKMTCSTSRRKSMAATPRDKICAPESTKEAHKCGGESSGATHEPPSPLFRACHPDHAPPITARKLSELDFFHIVQNPQIRHELSFDGNGHFTPSSDGPRKDYKKREAAAYWSALQAELQLRVDIKTNFQSDISEELTPKLREVFVELGRILRPLVNEIDRPMVEEMLEVELLMQQVRAGTLDYLNLASKLARVLKQHCAPLRDRWVDDMVEQFRIGVESGKVEAVVVGVRLLFGLLELMKLDVANHSIQLARPLLIHDAVRFEQGYFLTQITMGKLDALPAIGWYATYQSFWEVKVEFNGLKPRDRPVAVFVRGLVDLLRPRNLRPWPTTLAFDFERLRRMRRQVWEAVGLELCLTRFQMCIYDEQEWSWQVPAESITALRERLLALRANDTPDDGDDFLECWHRSIPQIAVELSRHVESLSRQQAALSRLQLVCASESTTRLDDLEHDLRVDFHLHSDAWHQQEDRAIDALWSATLHQTIHALTLPAFVATRPVSNAPHLASSTTSRSPPGRSVDDAEGSNIVGTLSRSLAQVACFHWRVFGPLVYLQKEEWESSCTTKKLPAESSRRAAIPGQVYDYARASEETVEQG